MLSCRNAFLSLNNILQWEFVGGCCAFRHRLPLRKEKCEDKKGLDGIRAVREYLMSLYKQSAAAAAQAEEEAEAAIHQDYMDLTDSDEDDVSD